MKDPKKMHVGEIILMLLACEAEIKLERRETENPSSKSSLDT